MNDYISRQSVWELISELKNFYEQEGNEEENFLSKMSCVGSINALTAMEDGLSDIPAADVRPVVHGKWAHLGGDEWCCTNCGNVISTEGSWEHPYQKCCPNCGAKMDKES